MLLRAAALALTLALPAMAQDVADMAPRDGWTVIPTAQTFDQLVEGTRGAAKAGGLAVVTMAGPTDAAAQRGIDIPGNRVIGLYNNDFAVRVLRQSTAAMIEAPIRVYVTENADGTATLSYKLPSAVLAPYMTEAPDLAAIAAELDAAFATVAATATGS
ncbi:DUF302 domain-containing protein [Jannaschia pohangensis]|uniref:Uncharacterized conserved protein, DUF302 family n=1 Tax=Jannaschia pohangensis TaxID=390807 RepID=A0A1I3HFX6_9RHOB|nr:DUF302 domain-containing protein [Jannaschia pohangensis]SFI34645.1 Uncharacterized conserved protein, DUF302 family [Jannaschia pohangensis]